MKFLRLVAAAVLTVLIGLAGEPAAMAAPGDRFTTLDVTYAINTDGSVDVDYRLGYHFGSANRHGITFSIATGEVSPTDLAKRAVYGVEDVMVTDDQGNSIPFTSKDSDNSWNETSSCDLTIGDPEKTIDGTEASNRVRWHGTGMLRTKDGVPTLDWTVTSTHMPPVDSYRVRVTGPGPSPVRSVGETSSAPAVPSPGDSSSPVPGCRRTPN